MFFDLDVPHVLASSDLSQGGKQVKFVDGIAIEWRATVQFRPPTTLPRMFWLVPVRIPPCVVVVRVVRIDCFFFRITRMSFGFGLIEGKVMVNGPGCTVFFKDINVQSTVIGRVVSGPTPRA